MSQDISPNKVGEKQERRAEHIEDTLKKQDMGEDEAEKRALEAALDEDLGSLRGGTNAANEPKTDSSHVGNRRTGSQSNADT